MSRKPASGSGYCAYCFRKVSLKNDGTVWQHKPGKLDSAKYAPCPGEGVVPLPLADGEPTGVSQFKADLASGLHWTVETYTNKEGKTGTRLTYTGPSLQPISQYPDAETVLQGLRDEAATILPDTGKESWTKQEVQQLLMAFLSLPEGAQHAAALSQIADRPADGDWKTPDGERLYTEEEQEEALAKMENLLGATADENKDMLKEVARLESEISTLNADLDWVKANKSPPAITVSEGYSEETVVKLLAAERQRVGNAVKAAIEKA